MSAMPKGKEVITIYEPWPKVGDVVVWCDPKGRDHHALVTANWGAKPTHPAEYGPVINVVFVSGNETELDSYGRQIARETSVSHARCPGTPHGRYWRWPAEDRNEYVPPSSV